jgi:transcriptional regulator with XRE-family HTH domain
MPTSNRGRPNSKVKRGRGREIRQARIAAKLTIEDLANTLGVSSSTVCEWEHGNKAPRLGRLAALAAALRIDVRSLL